jgi:putative transposase
MQLVLAKWQLEIAEARLHTRVAPASGPCNLRTARMNAITERSTAADADASCQITPSSGTRAICRGSCAYETHHNQHRPHRSLGGAAPLKPLSEPVDPGQYRARNQARAGGLINEHRLVA